VKNLLVVIDACEAANMASPIMEKTLELARAFSSKVWIIHIVPDLRRPAPFNVDSNVMRREVTAELCDEHEILQRLSQCLRNRDINAKALLIEGATIKTILKESQRLDIELIILGCHRHSLVFGVLTEFAEEGLLGKCPCPIMFVPMSE
jgi:nucleotide-binding universal stress UspA family protein